MDLHGKNAFITGGANGIGLGTAIALAKRGVHVAIGDVESETLSQACAEISKYGTKAIGITVDVSNRKAVEDAFRQFQAQLGEPHILFNNAGVTLNPSSLLDMPQAQWDWLFGVNIFGVINSLRAFVPAMKAHGHGGHIVTASSIVAMSDEPKHHNVPYRMTKAALLAMSEMLDFELDLSTSNIAVSVLLPAFVRTTLGRSPARRPKAYGGSFEAPRLSQDNENVTGMTPDQIGERVVYAIANKEFFILTHHETRPWVRERNARVEAAYDDLAAFDAGLACQPGRNSS